MAKSNLPKVRALCPIHAVAYDPERGELVLLDQTLIPREEKYLRLDRVDAIVEAIQALRVRGAPAIGVAAAYGLCAVARHSQALTIQQLEAELDGAADAIEAARPTAVNLMHAMARLRRAKNCGAANARQLIGSLEKAARQLYDEELAASTLMGKHAFKLFHDGDGVITHCNTGALAAPGAGTALGTVLYATQRGMKLHVYADETRPLLQGGRLTTWECLQQGIPCTLITDSMAAVVLRDGKVQLAVVGADRIAANGDAANKIGTYGLAVQCRVHRVPFFVVAPTSTVDLNAADGRAIPIEQRSADEVRGAFGVRWAPEEVGVYNPAFDVTPAKLISGIVTERGLVRPPYRAGLRQVCKQQR